VKNKQIIQFLFFYPPGRENFQLDAAAFPVETLRRNISANVQSQAGGGRAAPACYDCASPFFAVP